MTDVEGRPKVEFQGYFPPLAGAIKIAGDEGGMRFVIEVDSSQMAWAIPIIGWQGKLLKITIEPIAG